MYFLSFLIFFIIFRMCIMPLKQYFRCQLALLRLTHIDTWTSQPVIHECNMFCASKSYLQYPHKGGELFLKECDPSGAWTHDRWRDVLTRQLLSYVDRLVTAYKYGFQNIKQNIPLSQVFTDFHSPAVYTVILYFQFCEENNIKVHSIMTHFAAAWDNPDFTSQQLNTFLNVAQKYR